MNTVCERTRTVLPAHSERGEQSSSQRANTGVAVRVPRSHTSAADALAEAEPFVAVDRLLAKQTAAAGTSAAGAGRNVIVDEEPVIEREHGPSMAAVTVTLRGAFGDNDVNPQTGELSAALASRRLCWTRTARCPRAGPSSEQNAARTRLPPAPGACGRHRADPRAQSEVTSVLTPVKQATRCALVYLFHARARISDPVDPCVARASGAADPAA
jgi:hypothetical protein